MTATINNDYIYGSKLYVGIGGDSGAVYFGRHLVFTAHVWKVVDGVYGLYQSLKRGTSENAEVDDAVLCVAIISNIFHDSLFC